LRITPIADSPVDARSNRTGYTEADIEAGHVYPVGYKETHVRSREGTSAALPSHIDRQQVRSRQSCRTLPFTSNVDLLCDFDGVVDLDAEIANGAPDLGVSEQELHCSQISCPLVDQHCLRAT